MGTDFPKNIVFEDKLVLVDEDQDGDIDFENSLDWASDAESVGKDQYTSFLNSRLTKDETEKRLAELGLEVDLSQTISTNSLYGAYQELQAAQTAASAYDVVEHLTSAIIFAGQTSGVKVSQDTIENYAMSFTGDPGDFFEALTWLETQNDKTLLADFSTMKSPAQNESDMPAWAMAAVAVGTETAKKRAGPAAAAGFGAVQAAEGTVAFIRTLALRQAPAQVLGQSGLLSSSVSIPTILATLSPTLLVFVPGQEGEIPVQAHTEWDSGPQEKTPSKKPTPKKDKAKKPTEKTPEPTTPGIAPGDRMNPEAPGFDMAQAESTNVEDGEVFDIRDDEHHITWDEAGKLEIKYGDVTIDPIELIPHGEDRAVIPGPRGEHLYIVKDRKQPRGYRIEEVTERLGYSLEAAHTGIYGGNPESETGDLPEIDIHNGPNDKLTVEIKIPNGDDEPLVEKHQIGPDGKVNIWGIPGTGIQRIGDSDTFIWTSAPAQAIQNGWGSGEEGLGDKKPKEPTDGKKQKPSQGDLDKMIEGARNAAETGKTKPVAPHAIEYD